MSDEFPTATPASEATVPKGQGMRALVSESASSQPKLPMLAGVVEQLASCLTMSFRTIWRGPAEARADEPTPVRFADFFDTLPAGPMIAVLRMGSWNGPCLAVIGSDLAYATVGLLLGGGTATAVPPIGTAIGQRERTVMERTVMERLVRDVIAGNIARSFAQITELDVTLDRMAVDAADAAIARPRTPCLTWGIAVTAGGHESTIRFLLPYATVEPIRGLLSRDPSGSGPGVDPPWHSHLRRELPDISMKVRAVLERRRASASEVLRWRVGSTFVLNHRPDEPVDVFCNDLLVLRARMAEQDGRIALHVDERRLAEDWPMPAQGAPD